MTVSRCARAAIITAGQLHPGPRPVLATWTDSNIGAALRYYNRPGGACFYSVGRQNQSRADQDCAADPSK
jgi:hypothetical protein